MKSLFFALFIGCFGMLGVAQKALTPADMKNWNAISSHVISNDGAWVVYTQAPYVGDGELHVYQTATGTDTVFERGVRPQISAQSDYVVFMIKPQVDTLRRMKLDEVPRKKWPVDTLAVYVMSADTLLKFPGVKSFQMADEGQNLMAFQYSKPQKGKKKPSAPAKKKKKKKKKEAGTQPVAKPSKKNIKRKVSDVVIYDPMSYTQIQIANASSYTVSTYGDAIGVIQSFGDTIDSTGVFWYDARAQKMDTAYYGLGKSTQMTFDESGKQAAWLTSADTGKAKAYAVYYSAGNKGTRIVVDTNNTGLTLGFTPSENGRVYFSKNGRRLFFGAAKRPQEEPKDTIPADEKAQVDVWSYSDLQPQPMQLLRKRREEKKTYLHVFNMAQQKVVPLANDSTSYVYGLMSGDAQVAIVTEAQNYELSNSWKYPFNRDYYLVDMQTGEREVIKKNLGYNTSISPSGAFFAYYDAENTAWWVRDVGSGKEINVSATLSEKGQVWFDEQSQIPALPFAFGVEGWTSNEDYVIINAKYDVWLVDPRGEKAPVSLSNGQADKEKQRLRLMNFDRDEPYIRIDSVLLFQGQNKVTNQHGFVLRYPNGERIVNMAWGEESYTRVRKARHANQFILRPGAYRKYPDIAITKAPFKNMIDGVFDELTTISNVNPQMKEYAWGNVYKHYWTDKNGVSQRGLLYVPDSTTKNGKSPAIIYFYEKYFSSEYSYKTFAPSRSVISVPLYVSNGYVVLIPDINYGVGHPGKDATETVEGAAQSLIDEGWVNPDKIGIQGQSWGGYQVAQIITQSNMFAAGMAGAPVSNMTSAYGGIRWGSGMSREFQYETTQSRIGNTLWGAPELYIENSPLFHLPNVTTPVLIMHNDADGAVPYYQGIEMFMGLRRLQKPAWLLVYNKEQHNLTKMPNRIDLTQRMFQFFNHYLKDAPAPKWMVKGVPAIEKGKDYGFELTE